MIKNRINLVSKHKASSLLVMANCNSVCSLYLVLDLSLVAKI